MLHGNINGKYLFKYKHFKTSSNQGVLADCCLKLWTRKKNFQNLTYVSGLNHQLEALLNLEPKSCFLSGFNLVKEESMC